MHPTERFLDEVVQVLDRQTVGRQQGAARHDAQLRHLRHGLRSHVHTTRNALEHGLGFPAQPLQFPEVIPEDFHRHSGPGPTQHVVDAVGNGLSHAHIHARQGGQTRSHPLQKCPAVARDQVEGCIDFRGVDVLGMFVQLRPTGPPGHHIDLGHVQQDLLGLAAHPFALCDGHARRSHQADDQGALVEGRQKGPPQSRGPPGTPQQQRGRHRERGTRPPQHGRQPPHVHRRQPPFHPGPLGVPRRRPVQPPRAQHGREGHRHHERGQHRSHEGDAQRLQQPTLHAPQEKQRHKRHQDDERSHPNRAANLHRSVAHHLHHRPSLPLGQQPVAPQPPEHILHIDDRVIHQRPDGDGHAPQAHGVDSVAQTIQNQHTNHERNRNGEQRDDGGPQVHQEHQQHHHHEEGAFDQGPLEVRDGHLNEVGLPEHIGAQLDPAGEGGMQFLHGRVQPARQFQGVDVGLLGDGHHHGGAGVAGPDADGVRRCPSHLGDVPDAPGGSGDNRPFQVGSGLQPSRGLDEIAVAEVLHGATACPAGRGPDRVADLGKRKAGVGELEGVGLDLQLAHSPAQHSDIRHAPQPHEPGPDLPIRQGPQALRVHRIGLQGEQEDFAHHGRNRRQRGFPHPLGQLIPNQEQALIDELPGPVGIGLPVKLYPNDGDAPCR